MDLQSILFDFDGVLCRDRFYRATLLPDHQDICDWIQANIFSDKELTHKWMRGQTDSAAINRLISEKTGIGYELLNGLYEESIRSMKLEAELVDLARSLKAVGKKIGIVTDNMDVFTRITIPNHRLSELFHVVINSADHGLLKRDENGRLFDIALGKLGSGIEDSLMIDDNATTIELYKQKGGQGFVYHANTPELTALLQSKK